MPKKSKKSKGPSPIKQELSKKGLVEVIAEMVTEEEDGVPFREEKQMVSKMIDALGEVMARSVMPGGAGSFKIPKTLKVTLKEKKAVKKGTLVRNPATGEMIKSKGKPASKKVKINALSGLKKAAAGEL